MYCYGRWGFSDRRGRQLIDAAEVAKELGSETGTMVPPTNEAQARELAPLVKNDPELARAVWRDAMPVLLAITEATGLILSRDSRAT